MNTDTKETDIQPEAVGEDGCWLTASETAQMLLGCRVKGERRDCVLGWLYIGATGPPVYPCWGRGVHAWRREEESGPSWEPDREETMPTYAFCVLQTFHRLCKTSESVWPLEVWEGGRKGGREGDRWTDTSGLLQQFTSHLPGNTYPSPDVGWCGFVRLIPKHSPKIKNNIIN